MAGREVNSAMVVASEIIFPIVIDNLVRRGCRFTKLELVPAEYWDAQEFSRIISRSGVDGGIVDMSFFGMTAALNMLVLRDKPVVGVFSFEGREGDVAILQALLKVSIIARKKSQDLGELIRQAGEELRIQYHKLWG